MFQDKKKKKKEAFDLFLFLKKCFGWSVNYYTITAIFFLVDLMSSPNLLMPSIYDSNFFTALFYFFCVEKKKKVDRKQLEQ